jgi:hypothetical protein
MSNQLMKHYKMRDAEQRFEEYREYLRQELVRLATYIKLYRCLYDRRRDRLDEMYVAPAFFQTTTDALFTAIILWVDKLLGNRSERGLVDFLKFVERNRRIFDIKELQRRREYPDDHWMLRRDPITLDTVCNHREAMQNMSCLNSFKLRRDKFHAHFDKDYFFDRKRINEEAPIEWKDLDKVLEVSTDILNTYSPAYDGNLYEIEPVNAADVEVVLDIIRRHKGYDKS